MKLTEYQKKKLVDLALLIVAALVVGFFLKTQLSDPIVLDISDQLEAEGYGTGKQVFDHLILDGIEIDSSELRIDSAFIEVHIKASSILDEAIWRDHAINWQISFDSDQNAQETGDVSVSIKQEGLTKDDLKVSFQLKDWQGTGEAGVDGKEIIIRIPNNEKLKIDSGTAYKLFSKNKAAQ